MGPEEGNAGMGDFSMNVPPSFGGDTNYSQYRNNVLFWVSLTTIPPDRQGAALIGRLYGEAKVSATTLEVEDICSANGVQTLLTHLDRSYGVDEHNQLNAAISAFMNYTWLSTYSVDQFISGFNSRLDRVSCLGFDDSVKGHLLLKLSGLSQPDQNIVVASAGGDYSLKKISTALRNAFQRLEPPAASMHSTVLGSQPRSVLAHQPRSPHWRDHTVSDTSSIGTQGGNHSYHGREVADNNNMTPAATRGSGEYRPRRGRDTSKRENAPRCRPTFFTVCSPSHVSASPKLQIKSNNTDEGEMTQTFHELRPLDTPSASKPHVLPPLLDEFTGINAEGSETKDSARHLLAPGPVGRTPNQDNPVSAQPFAKKRKVVSGKRIIAQRIDETSAEVLQHIVNGRTFEQSDVEHAFLRGLCESERDDEDSSNGSSEEDSSDDSSEEDSSDDSSEEDNNSDSSDDNNDDNDVCSKQNHSEDDDEDEGDYNPTYMSTFITFASQHEDGPINGAIIDSGACTSVVGRITLDKALTRLKIDKLVDGKPTRVHHQFGPNSERHPTICSVQFPFWGDDRQEPLFDIQFDVIEGNLPFLVGLPSLVSMRANLNFSYKWLGFKTGEDYLKLALHFLDSHIVLPFRATIKKNDQRKTSYQDKSSYYTPMIHESSEDGLSDEGRSHEYYTPSTRQGDETESSTNNIYRACHAIPAEPNSDMNLSLGGYQADQEPEYYQQADKAWKYVVRELYDPSLTNAQYSVLPINVNDERCVTNDEHPDGDAHYRSTSGGHKQFNAWELRKIHLHLKHGTATQMKDYLKVAQWWSPGLESSIDKVVESCPCTLGDGPSPHPIVGTKPPSTLKQTHVSIDVITISGMPFLHCIDHGTKWSETEGLRSHALTEQVRAFKVAQLYRHGVPRVVTADGEYCKGAFKDMCAELNIQLITTPGHSHQCNGRVERANRAVRSYYNRLRACNPAVTTQLLVAEATFAKNICIGRSKASPFELIYGRSPLFTGDDTPARASPPTIEETAAQSAREKLNLMLRKNARRHQEVKVGDMVFIWRDNSGWIGPAPVTTVDEYQVTVRHNNYSKSASRNRVRRIVPQGDEDSDTEPDDLSNEQSHPMNDPDIDGINNKRHPSPKAVDPVHVAELAEHDAMHDTMRPMEDEAAIDTNEASILEHGTFDKDTSAELNVLTSTKEADESASVQPALEQAIEHDEQPEETSEEGVPRAAAEPSTPEVLVGVAHPNFDKEKRRLVDEANRFINAPCELGRTRSKTHDKTNDATQLTIDLDEVTVAIKGASATDDRHASASVSWASATFVTEPNKSLSTEERTASFNKELQVWKNRKAFKRIGRNDAPAGANVIGSHTVFRRKDDGSAKARIVPWGHRDPARYDLRCDLPCLNPDIFRLTLSIAAEKAWRVCQMDAEAAFLQARGFSRAVYVRPPKESNDPNGLWLLLAPAYGLADSGRLWYRTNDEALLNNYDLTRSLFEPTMYFHKDDSDMLDFLLVVQVDNYLYCGTQQELARFEQFLQAHFKIGSLERDQFPVLGCELIQASDGTIDITQKARAASIDTNALNTVSTKGDGDRLATPVEIRSFRSVIGQCLYIGRLTNPVLQYHCSSMASKVSALRARHLKTLKSIVNGQTRNPPTSPLGIPPSRLPSPFNPSRMLQWPRLARRLEVDILYSADVGISPTLYSGVLGS